MKRILNKKIYWQTDWFSRPPRKSLSADVYLMCEAEDCKHEDEHEFYFDGQFFYKKLRRRCNQ